MLNFRNLIGAGTDELAPKYKKTTPSDDFANQLLPGLGAPPSATGTGQPDDFQYAGRGAAPGGGLSDTVTKKNPYLGALGGLANGFQQDSGGAPPLTPIAIDPGMQVQLPQQIPYNMRGLANGGEVQDGETVQVGENGKELVHKTADGKVFVLPNPQTLMQNKAKEQALPATATPEQYGLGQTVQGDDARPNLSYGENDAINRQVGLPTSGAPMGSGQPDNYQYAGRGTIGQDAGQTVTPTPSSDGKMMPNAQDLMGMGTPNGAPTMSPHQQRYADVLQQMATAGQVHPNKAKDAAFGALQGFNNAINHINQPIQDYSQLKAQRRMTVIEPQLQAAQAGVAMDTAASAARDKSSLNQSEINRNNAIAGYNDNRPAIEEAKNATKLAVTKLTGQRIADNINRRADIKSGDAKPVVNGQGQLELEFLHTDSQGNRKPNELVKGADGNPITVPGEEGVEWTNPVTNKTELIKAKQDVGYATGQERLNETNRHNTTEEGQGQQRIDFEKNVMQPYREAGLKLRQDEFNFRQSGNTKGADDANRKRISLVSSIKSRQSQGQLSDADANALINELNAPLGGTAGASITPHQ